MPRSVTVGRHVCGEGHPLLWILGPCVIESEEMTRRIAFRLKEIAEGLGVPVVFKASYDKANRSRLDSFRGPGIWPGGKILQLVKRDTGLPITTDIHLPGDPITDSLATVDLIQVPAFLCRQTDLLAYAARHGSPVNVKRGQFVAPWDMANVVDKLRRSGRPEVVLTERGSCFGHGQLVSDMRNIPEMQRLGCPVIFDATHSVQGDYGPSFATLGRRWAIPHLARAAVAAGADGLFLEVHPDPDHALSDGANMLPLDQLPELIRSCERIRAALEATP